MIGRIIRWKRLIAGWSMNALAKKMHITVSHLSNIENGRRKPSIEIEIWASEIFDLPPHFSEVEQVDNQTFYAGIKEIIMEGDLDKIATIKRIQKKNQLTSQQYLVSDIFARSLTTFSKKKKRKEIYEFLHTIYLNENLNSQLRRAALCYLLMDSISQENFPEAQNYASNYIDLIESDEEEERVCLLLKQSMIRWNLGIRTDLLRTLPEIKVEIDQLEHSERYVLAWNYLYGKCLIYYGFIEEAAYFLEKNIKQAKSEQKPKSVLTLISKILLFAYTDKFTPEKNSIIAAIKRNANDHYFMRNVLPYIYTMASSLINFGKIEEAKQVASLAENYTLTNENLPNRQFYLILLNTQEENKEVVEYLSERYFEEESRIAANPFQAMDICKMMIQHFEGKTQFKNASKWGYLATKISTSYFGTRSLA